MDEPIPVSLAIRAVERAIRECDAVDSGLWYMTLCLIPYRAEDAFCRVAHAGFRASLEYLRWSLHGYTWLNEPLVHEQYAAVAPLIAHYDAVQPGWRTE